jgi:hypothetical protein
MHLGRFGAEMLAVGRQLKKAIVYGASLGFFLL